MSTLKNDIKVQYLYDMTNLSAKCELQDACIKKEYNAMKILGWKTQLVRAAGWVEKPFYDMGDLQPPTLEIFFCLFYLAS